jgi:hypothetical protein
MLGISKRPVACKIRIPIFKVKVIIVHYYSASIPDRVQAVTCSCMGRYFTNFPQVFDTFHCTFLPFLVDLYITLLHYLGDICHLL